MANCRTQSSSTGTLRRKEVCWAAGRFSLNMRSKAETSRPCFNKIWSVHPPLLSIELCLQTYMIMALKRIVLNSKLHRPDTSKAHLMLANLRAWASSLTSSTRNSPDLSRRSSMNIARSLMLRPSAAMHAATTLLLPRPDTLQHSLSRVPLSIPISISTTRTIRLSICHLIICFSMLG